MENYLKSLDIIDEIFIKDNFKTDIEMWVGT